MMTMMKRAKRRRSVHGRRGIVRTTRLMVFAAMTALLVAVTTGLLNVPFCGATEAQVGVGVDGLGEQMAIVDGRRDQEQPEYLLRKASAEHDISMVKHVLEQGGVDIHSNFLTKEWGTMTAIMLASQEGYPDIVAMLIEAGADVNAMSRDGATCLLYSAFNGHSDVVAVLIKAGADLNKGHGQRGGKTALMFAAEKGFKDIAHLLVDAGADVNVKEDGRDFTALHFATVKGKQDIVKILIEAKAVLDGSIKTDSPLIMSILEEQFEITRMLINGGAKMNMGDVEDGLTPLMFAAAKNYKDVAEMLVQHGADIRQLSNEGAAALDYAAFHKHMDIVNILKTAMQKHTQ